MMRIQAHVHSCANSYQLPLRMMVSDSDQICDAKAAKSFAQRWGGPVQLAVYPELYHELMNEPEKETVIGELIQWMNALND